MTDNLLPQDHWFDNLGDLSSEELDALLFECVNTIAGRDKVQALLKAGAKPNQVIDGEMLWEIAFSRDTISKHTDEEIISDLIISYVFRNFSAHFLSETVETIEEAIQKNTVLIQRSQMLFNNLGYEPNDAEEKLDLEYEWLMDDLAQKITAIDRKYPRLSLVKKSL